MPQFNHSAATLCVVLAWTSSLAGQDFPTPFNTEPAAVTPAMTPEQARDSFKMPAGFEVELFAGEPHVQNPIDMAWDSQGRLWVAENYTYAERKQRFQLGLRDRVIVLEDQNRDGRHDRRTVFTDTIQRLTSVEVGHGGVWLMCPPKLLFVPDDDGDLVPDGPAEVILDGFTVAPQNYHNFANGLRFGPDGWLYGRCGGSCPGKIGHPSTPPERRFALEGGIWRYHPRRHDVEVVTAGTTNPWGHDWDENGQLFFINTVNGHLWHGIDGAHFKRPFTLDPNRRVHELIDFHADHWHFDTGKSWTKSRDGAANDFGGGHAHSGLMIYQAENWPASYRGELFTLNFHGRRINQETLRRNGCGFVASHNPDPISSADPWFRGMDLRSGPDGGVYVLDWSDTGECHEHTGVHRTSGRIFKITYRESDAKADTEPPASPPVDLRRRSATELVDLQRSDNVWFARQSRLELARRAFLGEELGPATEAARALFGSSKSRDQVRALLTRAVTGDVAEPFLVDQLEHPNEHVRIWAIKLLTETMPIDDCFGPVQTNAPESMKNRDKANRLLPSLCRLAASEPSGLVRLTLASTLQRLPVDLRCRLAEKLVSRAEDVGDHNQPLLIWYGLMPVVDSAPEQLLALARRTALPTTLRLMTRGLTEKMESHPELVDGLIRHASQTENVAWRDTMITGLSEGLRGWRRAERPRSWDELLTAVSDPKVTARLRKLGVVFGDGRAIAQVRQTALDSNTPPTIRIDALETLISTRPDDLQDICTPLLRDPRLNMTAVRGLALIDDVEVGNEIVRRYRNFRSPNRPHVISILSSRRPFARALLSGIRRGQIPRTDLSAFDVRQIKAHGDRLLADSVRELWGDVRETDEQKTKLISRLRRQLDGRSHSSADLRSGRALFQKVCQNCHRLYGTGGAIGPDLTGANRSDLDYLLGNIVDPSAVVDKDYRMTLLLLDDGRLLSGLVTQRSEKTITVHWATGSETVATASVESEKTTDKSPMPDGLLDTLSPQQVAQLIGYLSHPQQVPLGSD